MSDAGRRIAHNAAAHDRLRGAYDARHPEIHNEVEQARLVAAVGRAVAAIRTRTAPSQRVMLDVGAGTGNLTTKLLAHPGRVIASDLSSRMLADLAARLGAEPGAEGRLTTQRLDGRSLRPIADASVDLAGLYSVLHHVPDYLALVDELARVVRPGGVILIEHEKAPSYWRPSPALARFFAEAVRRPPKRWTRFLDPRRYWARVRPLLVWQRWSDPRWMPEGDLHIWPDDHVEWALVEARLVHAGCELVEVDDHLAYEPRYDRATWERYRMDVSDTRMCIARRLEAA